jgi:transposase-like protein
MSGKRKEESRTTVLIDELLAERGITYEAVMGRGGLVEELTQRLLERALAGELNHHLGYGKGESKPVTESLVDSLDEEESEQEVEKESKEQPPARKNCRNGYSRKRVLSKDGAMEIAVPRDRAGEFEPQIISKGQRRFNGFDDRIIALYAGGMTVREIQCFLLEQYRVEISPEFISTVTDSVREDVVEWQSRPLERMYPVVFFDAIRVKIRDGGMVKNKAVHIALGVNESGCKEVLGFWIEEQEGAKFWLKVMYELRNRGVADILIAVVDGLSGFPEAIKSVFEQTTVQTCVVHLIRNSLAMCGWKERKEVMKGLREIYQASTAELAAMKLEEFAASACGKKYPMMAGIWRRAWEQVIPFFSYPPEIRRLIYTTNAIESLNMQLRKSIKTRGHFPNDEAATKLIYLTLKRINVKWQTGGSIWRQAVTQFRQVYGERFTASAS